MRRAGVDAGRHRRGRRRLKRGQRRKSRFLPGQRLKFFLLTRRFGPRPFADGVACDRLNPANAGGDRTFAHDSEGTDLAGRAHVRAAAEFHRVTVQFVRRAADLHHAHEVAVFVAEELHDVGPLLRFRVGNFRPRDGRVLRDLFVHQLFHVAHLLLREGGTGEIEGQLLRPDVAAFLRRVAADDFVQRPMQQMRHGVMALDRGPARAIESHRDVLANGRRAFARDEMNRGVA